MKTARVSTFGVGSQAFNESRIFAQETQEFNPFQKEPEPTYNDQSSFGEPHNNFVKKTTYSVKKELVNVLTQTEDFHCNCCRRSQLNESYSSIGQLNRQMPHLAVSKPLDEANADYNMLSPMSKKFAQKGSAMKINNITKNMVMTASIKTREMKNKNPFQTSDMGIDRPKPAKKANQLNENTRIKRHPHMSTQFNAQNDEEIEEIHIEQIHPQRFNRANNRNNPFIQPSVSEKFLKKSNIEACQPRLMPPIEVDNGGGIPVRIQLPLTRQFSIITCNIILMQDSPDHKFKRGSKLSRAIPGLFDWKH